MVNKRWLIIVIVGWFLLYAAAFIFRAKTSSQLVIWMIIQQSWLIIGSLIALRNISVISWDLGEVGWGIIAGIGLFLANTTINLVIFTILSKIFQTEQVIDWLRQEQRGVRLLLDIKSPGMFCLAAGLFTVGASLSEELLFRGALLTALREVTTTKWAVIISALCFALVHFYIIQFVPVLISGLIFGLLFTAKNSILRPITAHTVANTLSLLTLIGSFYIL